MYLSGRTCSPQCDWHRSPKQHHCPHKNLHQQVDPLYCTLDSRHVSDHPISIYIYIYTCTCQPFSCKYTSDMHLSTLQLTNSKCCILFCSTAVHVMIRYIAVFIFSQSWTVLLSCSVSKSSGGTSLHARLQQWLLFCKMLPKMAYLLLCIGQHSKMLEMRS